MMEFIVNVVLFLVVFVLFAWVIQSRTLGKEDEDVILEMVLKSKLKKVTRLEVIDDDGRAYVTWDNNNKVSLSIQDQGKTLKIFITKKQSNGK